MYKAKGTIVSGGQKRTNKDSRDLWMNPYLVNIMPSLFYLLFVMTWACVTPKVIKIDMKIKANFILELLR